MLKNFVKLFGGDPNKKVVEQYSGMAREINDLEPEFEALTDDALRAKTDEFRAHVAELVGNVEGLEEKELFKLQQDALEEILPEAFAAVREASKRTLGQRHYDVQMIGGVALHRGSIAEMRTGEGKTLVATLPLYLNALLDRGVHLITVNDYLSRRDARWMAPIFQLLGLSVGILQMAAATENGKKAFIVDFEKESPHEDQRHMRLVDRRLAYECDITYGTNAEFGFDYLRDNMTMRLNDRVQRGHHFAIIDEVDNVLIDEARTPLIISGPASGNLEWYGKMSQVVNQLKPEDYEINEKDRNIALTEVGLARAEQLLGDPERGQRQNQDHGSSPERDGPGVGRDKQQGDERDQRTGRQHCEHEARLLRRMQQRSDRGCRSERRRRRRIRPGTRAGRRRATLPVRAAGKLGERGEVSAAARAVGVVTGRCATRRAHAGLSRRNGHDGEMVSWSMSSRPSRRTKWKSMAPLTLPELLVIVYRP